MTSYQPPSILPQLAPTTAAPPLATTAFPIPLAEDSLGAPAKMFVGGLPQSVTQDSLREYFGRFGRISEAFVLMDEASGRSRGFGFVTFENPGSLQRVLNSRPHYLDGKCVDCKHAVLKGQGKQEAPSTGPIQQANLNPNSGGAAGGGVQTNLPQSAQPAAASTATNTGVWSRTFKPARSNEQQPQQQAPPVNTGSASASSGTLDSTRDAEEDDELFLTGGGKSYLALSGDKWLEDCAEADERKIFVGGLPDVTPAEFASFFEHFGPVADAMVMFDRKRRRQRGFGFITFATSEGVLNALQFNRHPVKGKLAEVKKAHPLVLQKARAPAKKEREAAQQLEKRSSPNGTAATTGGSGKRKNSVASAGPPWTKPQSTDFNWSAGKKARNEADEGVPPTDPFAAQPIPEPAEDVWISKFPSAPWNQDLEKRKFGSYEEEQQQQQHSAVPVQQGLSRPATSETRPHQYMGEGYPVPPYYSEIPLPPMQFAGPPPAYGYPPAYATPSDPYTAMMGNKYFGDEAGNYGQGYEPPFLSK